MSKISQIEMLQTKYKDSIFPTKQQISLVLGCFDDISNTESTYNELMKQSISILKKAIFINKEVLQELTDYNFLIDLPSNTGEKS